MGFYHEKLNTKEQIKGQLIPSVTALTRKEFSAPVVMWKSSSLPLSQAEVEVLDLGL